MQRLEGWPYVYRRQNGTLYYVRRVPSDLAEALTERQFKRSLKHRDQRLPAFKAVYDAVHREVEAYIAKVRRGLAVSDACSAYRLASLRAQRLGFDLRPMDELASDAVSVDDLVDRLIAVEGKIGDARDPDVDAVLGAVETPSICTRPISAARMRASAGGGATRLTWRCEISSIWSVPDRSTGSRGTTP
ncbi:MAG: DUF6538 domain-containing protein [Pseudomonadota bacterium]